MIVFLIFTTVLVIMTIGSVIWIHSNFPDNLILIVAREWQALIGTLLGFMVLALTLVGQDMMVLKADARKKESAEKAYVGSVINDLDNIFRDQGTLFATILDDDEVLFPSQECETIFDIHSIYTSWGVAIENNLSSIIPDLTPQAYVLISETILIKNRFQDTMRGITIKDCITNPKRIKDYIIGTHKTYGDLLLAQQLRLKQHIGNME